MKSKRAIEFSNQNMLSPFEKASGRWCFVFEFECLNLSDRMLSAKIIMQHAAASSSGRSSSVVYVTAGYWWPKVTCNARLTAVSCCCCWSLLLLFCVYVRTYEYCMMSSTEPSNKEHTDSDSTAPIPYVRIRCGPKQVSRLVRVFLTCRFSYTWNNYRFDAENQIKFLFSCGLLFVLREKQRYVWYTSYSFVFLEFCVS